MNSFEYIEVSVRLEPFSEETAEMLMADLAELPYDSFLTEEPFLKAYIPLSEYRQGDLKVVLSGYADVADFKAVPIEGQNWNREWEQLDMGCGTAILGILAAKMGARKVFAVDIDAVAARSAWGNARWNRVGTRVETACGDASLLQMGTYDVILANIHRNILLEDMPTYVRSLRRGGRLLMSGFYEADIPSLKERALSLGLTWVGQTLRDDWACIEFAKN